MSLSFPCFNPPLTRLSSPSPYPKPAYANNIPVSHSVCRDLVSLDQPTTNPFRTMIPLITHFPYLQAIVVATSAMHLATLHRYHGHSARQELVDALNAKGKAIRLLRGAIEDVAREDTSGHGGGGKRTVILAAIVFFVNLDLIDSGKGGWEVHVRAAEGLISSLSRSRRGRGLLLGRKGGVKGNGGGERVGDWGEKEWERGRKRESQSESELEPLADAIAADCLTYRILGSTIGGDAVPGFGDDAIDVLEVLQRAQAHSYHCCPPSIMGYILSASQLCAHGGEGAVGNGVGRGSGQRDNGAARGMLASLFDQAHNFDVCGWVYNIQGLSPGDDLNARVSIASAHRAAACLYILLVTPSASTDGFMVQEETHEGLILEILHHLKSVPTDHVLLKGTVWPTFMAGAQTDDPVWRAWCLERLRAVWTLNPWICPWGYIRTAMEMLEQIWTNKADVWGKGGTGNWLHRLRNEGGRALIV